MKYCSECGAKVVLEQRRRAGAWRFVCHACRAVFYQTPKLATACLADSEGQLLLCRRAVEPERGLWEFPAGFVAPGETVAAAAARETLEEAGVEVDIGRPYALLHVAPANQLRVVYLGTLRSTAFTPGTETLEARLFHEHEVPWDALAFATTRETLRHYLTERKEGVLGFFFAEIVAVYA